MQLDTDADIGGFIAVIMDADRKERQHEAQGLFSFTWFNLTSKTILSEHKVKPRGFWL